MTTTKMAWLGATALLVACSGATTGVGTGADGGASSGGDAAGCTDKPLSDERACVPGVARAGAEITVAVDGTGCVACGGTLLPCQVTVSGTTIALSARERDCATNEPCPASCGLPQATCTIPPLPVGTYAVTFTDGVAADAAIRQLVVTADATATSCSLPPGGGDPGPIAINDFSQQCGGDGDCTVVIDGSTCGPCARPTAAIAKSGLADYQAAYREHEAECRDRGGVAACGACLQMVAVCNAGTCEARAPK